MKFITYAFILTFFFIHVKGNLEDLIIPDEHVEEIKKLPLREFNKFLGKYANMHIPVYLRKFVFHFFIEIFDIDLENYLEQDLEKYETFNQFFASERIPEFINIEETNCLVSPANSVLKAFGEVTSEGDIFEIKNVSYKLPDLIGTIPSKLPNYNPDLPYVEGLKYNPENKIYYINVFVNIKDYHRIHAPTDVEFQLRRHFAGDMLNFFPEQISDVFTQNERVALLGKWKHGFFSYVPIGGLLVSSINIYRDKDVVTNDENDHPGMTHDRLYDPPHEYDLGDAVGQFNVGSTVIMIFEGPDNIEFVRELETKLNVGNELCRYV